MENQNLECLFNNNKKCLLYCNLFLSIARFPEGDPAILKEQGGEASMEISTRDNIKI